MKVVVFDIGGTHIVNDVHFYFPLNVHIYSIIYTPIIIADFVFDLGNERGTDAFGSSGE